MNEDVTISFMPYNINNLDKIKGWNGFISPEGIFYKVYEFNKLVTFHDEYALILAEKIYKIDINKKYQQIIQNNQNLRFYNLGTKDMLINILGFVNFEVKANKVDVQIPNILYAGHKITNKQFLILEKLAKINHLNMMQINNQILKQEKDDYLNLVNSNQNLKKYK